MQSEKENDRKLKEVGIDTAKMVSLFGFKSRDSYYNSPRRAKLKAAAVEIIRLAGEHLSK